MLFLTTYSFPSYLSKHTMSPTVYLLTGANRGIGESLLLTL